LLIFLFVSQARISSRHRNVYDRRWYWGGKNLIKYYNKHKYCGDNSTRTLRAPPFMRQWWIFIKLWFLVITKNAEILWFIYFYLLKSAPTVVQNYYFSNENHTCIILYIIIKHLIYFENVYASKSKFNRDV